MKTETRLQKKWSSFFDLFKKLLTGDIDLSSNYITAIRRTLNKERIMLHFQVNAEKQVVAVATEYPQGEKQFASTSADGSGWMTRHDIESVEHAAQIAESAQKATGKTYLPIDSGAGCWPRFDVIEAPAVGEAVSYAFNGDYYPCGHIKSISASFRMITTTEGQKFYRRRESACWKYNGVWSLVDGHRSELNPSF